MRSDEAGFWDERFRREGVIWGEEPSPTARIAVKYLPANALVVEIGFGYGRDLAFMLRQGYRVWGVDLSPEARRRTEARLGHDGLWPERLETTSFEATTCPAGMFDAVLSHRMAHLLVTPQAVERFVETMRRVLRPGGVVCLGMRNTEDINPTEVRCEKDHVGEYLPRPGHWIRFWDDEGLRQAFGKTFTFLALERVCETESRDRPVPCHLTVLVARKMAGPESGEQQE
jgi:SAM-dependent methyltransferase